MRVLFRAVAVPLTLGLSALLVCPVHGAPSEDLLAKSGNFLCLLDTFGHCEGVHTGEAQPERLRVVDQTIPPKKIKKRKRIAPVDPTTGIMEEHNRQLRTRGATGTGLQPKAPRAPNVVRNQGGGPSTSLSLTGGNNTGGNNTGGNNTGGNNTGGNNTGGSNNIIQIPIGTLQQPLESAQPVPAPAP